MKDENNGGVVAIKESKVKVLETWGWKNAQVGQLIPMKFFNEQHFKHFAHFAAAQFLNEREAHDMGLSFPPANSEIKVEMASQGTELCWWGEVIDLRNRIAEALLTLKIASQITVREVKACMEGKIEKADLTPVENYVIISLRCYCGYRWRVIKVRGEELPPDWYMCPNNLGHDGHFIDGPFDMVPYTREELDELDNLLRPPPN